MATTGDEMQVPIAVVASQAVGHLGNIFWKTGKRRSGARKIVEEYKSWKAFNWAHPRIRMLARRRKGAPPASEYRQHKLWFTIRSTYEDNARGDWIRRHETLWTAKSPEKRFVPWMEYYRDIKYWGGVTR